MRREWRSSPQPRRLLLTGGIQVQPAGSSGRGDRTEPYLDRPVGPPRSPRLGPSGRVAAERPPESQVGRGERVALATGPHRGIVRGPGAESRQDPERGEGGGAGSGP